MNSTPASTMSQRFEESRVRDLIRLIAAEIEAGGAPEAVADEVVAVCVFANMPIVAGARPAKREAMVDRQCEAIKAALLNFVAAQPDPPGPEGSMCEQQSEDAHNDNIS